MAIKAALFACAIAATASCRGDRTPGDHEFSHPIERQPPGRNGALAPSEHHTDTETKQTIDQTGPVGETLDRQGTMNQSTGAAVQGRRTPRAARGTAMGFGTRFNAPSPDAQPVTPPPTKRNPIIDVREPATPRNSAGKNACLSAASAM